MNTTDVVAESKTCSICLNDIDSNPAFLGEREVILTCHHSFHKECIAEWFSRIHNCPCCRTPVSSNILILPAINPHLSHVLSDEQNIRSIRIGINDFRRIRRLDLNENTSAARTAAKVHSVASRVFNFK